jgi:NAD(P)-dependent dehydrogenase (short-subunit alcohol dehydrogenase family)
VNVLVTGGSRGIGAAIVEMALSRGHGVAFTYVERADAAQEICRAAEARAPAQKCKAYALDVRRSDEVERVGDRVLEDFEAIDAVVLNAGINRNAMAVHMSDQDWSDVLDTNLTGSFYVARHFLGHFVSRRRGRLVFLSSIAQAGLAGQASYSASKAGLLGLSAALAKEYGPRGITSNCVVAGFFDTDLTREGMSEGNREFALKYCPARRMGRLEEVASAALYLASEEASFVNGTALSVTGGLDWGP